MFEIDKIISVGTIFKVTFDFSLLTIYSRIIFWKFQSRMQIALIMGGWSLESWKVICDM